MSNDENKLGFFKKVLKSINDFDKYEDFALEKTSDAIKYALKLVLIFTSILCIALTYQYIQGFKNIFSYIKDELPYFKFENNILNFEEEKTIELKQNDSSQIIIIDTKSNIDDLEKYDEQVKSNNIAILILKDRIILQNPSITGKVEYNYSDISESYNIGNFDKNTLIEYISNVNKVLVCIVIFAILFIYLYPIYFITLLLDAFILAILARLVSLLSKMRMKFGPSFNIGVHALTLSVMLNIIYTVVNIFTGFEIKYFDWMYNAISYIYVIVAIFIIKSDFINRQMELIKLQEEQEKIKDEIKKDEENKDEKEKDKEKQNEKKPKKDKKNKEDNNLEGESPEGSNA